MVILNITRDAQYYKTRFMKKYNNNNNWNKEKNESIFKLPTNKIISRITGKAWLWEKKTLFKPSSLL